MAHLKTGIMHHLSSKVAFSITRKDKLPFQKREFPLLSEMCVDVVIHNFDKYNSIDILGEKYKQRVYDNLDITYPIVQLAKTITNYDQFWKNACFKKWGTEKLLPEHKTWRSMFFSRYLQEHIQTMQDASETSMHELNELVKAMETSTFRLRIDEVKCEIDFNEGLQKLKELEYLRVTAVKKLAKGDFQVSSASMSLTDVYNLSNLIACLPKLQTLELVCNQIDDDGLKLMVKHLQEHPRLHHLNLSHNKLSNKGARRIARIIKDSKSLRAIDLANNQIGYEGARCISLVLAEPECQLQSLNLGLNLIGDNPFATLLSDLKSNKNLVSLDLNSNLLTDESVPHLISYLESNTTLRRLNLSCNKITKSSYEKLKASLNVNKVLEFFDISGNDMDLSNRRYYQDQEIELNEMIIKRVLERDTPAGGLGKITFVSTPSLNNYLDALKAKAQKEAGVNDPILADAQVDPAAPAKDSPGKDAALADPAAMSTDGPALNAK